MIKVVVKFTVASNWRNHVRQFEALDEAKAFLDEKWHEWPIAWAWVFVDDTFYTKYVIPPSAAAAFSAGYARQKRREADLRRSPFFS